MSRSALKTLKPVIVGKQSIHRFVSDLTPRRGGICTNDHHIAEYLLRNIGLVWGLSDSGGITTEGEYTQLVIEFYRLLFANEPSIFDQLNQIAGQQHKLPWTHCTDEHGYYSDTDALMADSHGCYENFLRGLQPFSFTPPYSSSSPVRHTYGYTLFCLHGSWYCLIHNQGLGSADTCKDSLYKINCPGQLPRSLDAFIAQLGTIAPPKKAHRLFRVMMGPGSLPRQWGAVQMVMPDLQRAKQKAGYCARLAIEHALSDQIAIDDLTTTTDECKADCTPDIGLQLHTHLHKAHLQHRYFSAQAHQRSLDLFAMLLANPRVRRLHSPQDWLNMLEKMAAKMAVPFRGKPLDTADNRAALLGCLVIMKADGAKPNAGSLLEKIDQYHITEHAEHDIYGRNLLEAALCSIDEDEPPSATELSHIRRLMKTHAIDQADALKNTYIMLAIENQRPKLAYVLMQLGADLNKVNSNGQTVLSIAVKKNQAGILHQLLTELYKSELTAEQSRYIAQALDTAITHAYNECIEVFAAFDPKVLPIVNSHSDTCVHTATAAELSALLAENPKLPLNQANRHQASPLHLAAISGDLDKVKRLIEHGANLHQTNANNQTALHCAIKYGHREIALYLISQHTRLYPNQIDGEGYSLLFYAIKNEMTDIMRLLYQHGANLYYPIAGFSSTIEYAESLVAKDIEYQPVYDTLLAWQAIDDDATASLNDSDSEFNLPADFPINRPLNANNDTLLHLAAMKGRQAIYTTLVERGADKKRHNRIGLSAECLLKRTSSSRAHVILTGSLMPP